MPGPRVSVLLPVYNAERFVRAAIDSVLAQTMPDFEIVVVDDGSTDDSVRLVQEVGDDRIVLLTPGHSGVAGALNAGLEHCRSELVARLDADDLMEPNRLERQLAFLEARAELGGIASDFWVMDEDGRLIERADTPLRTVEDVTRHLRCGGRLVYCHPTVMYRRSAVLGVGGYDPTYEKSEDVELFIRMYEAGRPLVVQPERLTRIRYHRTSVSASSATGQFFLDGLAHSNHLLRSQGLPPRSHDEYVAWLNRSPIARIDTRARLHSAWLLGRSHQERIAGRRLRAGLMLAQAALLNPRKPMRRIRRLLPGG